MPVTRLKEFLDESHVKYVTIRHSPAFTSQEIAATAHVPGKELAKTVMVKIDGQMALAVLPASYRVDFAQMRQVTGAADIELATEQEFASRFPGCEVGAMPPFGNLYGMETFVSDVLTEDEEIAFNAGSHSELVRLSFTDFRRLVRPKILHFGSKAA